MSESEAMKQDPSAHSSDQKSSRLKALMDRGRSWLLDGNEAVGTHQPDDMKADAQWAAGQQQARGSRLLIWVSLATVLVLLIWASLGYIDEVVRGQGKVVPSRQVQVVQSLDGGIVKEILVHPGEHVEKGQVILRIDPTRYGSSLGENKAELLALKAKAARLQALASGEAFKVPEDVQAAAPPTCGDGAAHVGESLAGAQYQRQYCTRPAAPTPARAA